jgi:hypothetical protein
MIPKESDMPALRELEATVAAMAKAHAEMNDYTASRAYDACFQLYRARERGREPKPAKLDGLDRETFEEVQKICEKLLTSGPAPIPGLKEGQDGPVPLEKLLAYLRELTRSVERHTKVGGRYGYLTFLQEFIP